MILESHSLYITVGTNQALENANARGCDLEEALEKSHRQYLTLFFKVLAYHALQIFAVCIALVLEYFFRDNLMCAGPCCGPR